MPKVHHVAAAVGVSLCLFSGTAVAQSAHPQMSFFITSQGPGKGADLGGLAGADAHCQRLAATVGAGGKTWRAYLSAKAAGGKPAVHARDRIGSGPWHNAKGMLVASNLDDLHKQTDRISKANGLNEKGQPIAGRGETPNRHDILTGSDLMGRLMPGDKQTCNNWTSSAEDGSARVGHHDRAGRAGPGRHPESWVSAHQSRGCSQANLRSTGGDGLFYCFAVGQ